METSSASESDAPYDVYFYFPIRELENDRVKLTPFIPSVHAETFFANSFPYPELYTHLPFGPFSNAADFVNEFLEARIHRDPGLVLFAVIDKTRSRSQPDELEKILAGTIGFLNTSPLNRSTELGFIIILPPFQRTHVSTNAIGLLMQYALSLPQDGGIGLRRLQWQASAANHASVRAAERMGFRREALLRWDRVLKEGKTGNGRALRDGKGVGRDTVLLGFCWEDWDKGDGKEKTEKIMARK